MKKDTSLYLDSDLIEALKKKQINISFIVNEYLKSYVQPTTDLFTEVEQLETKTKMLRQEAERKQAVAQAEYNKQNPDPRNVYLDKLRQEIAYLKNRRQELIEKGELDEREQRLLNVIDDKLKLLLEDLDHAS